MRGTSELTTERLKLRRHRIEDAAVLYKNFGCDPQMYAWSGWNPYATMEMAEETVQRFIDSYQENGFYGWAIEYQGRLIGTAGAYDYDSVHSTIETGFSIERASWENGFASEALRCVLDYLCEQEGIQTVTAWCTAENTGSLKAMRKAGMRQVLTEKDGLEINGIKHDKIICSYTKG